MALLKAVGQPVPEGIGEEVAQPGFPFNDLTGRDWVYLFY